MFISLVYVKEVRSWSEDEGAAIVGLMLMMPRNTLGGRRPYQVLASKLRTSFAITLLFAAVVLPGKDSQGVVLRL